MPFINFSQLTILGGLHYKPYRLNLSTRLIELAQLMDLLFINSSPCFVQHVMDNTDFMRTYLPSASS
jgi:hypothetical protein